MIYHWPCVSTNCEPCSSVAFILEKYFYTGGLEQFKPMLFQGHLYKSVMLRKIRRIPWQSSGSDSEISLRGHEFRAWIQSLARKLKIPQLHDAAGKKKKKAAGKKENCTLLAILCIYLYHLYILLIEHLYFLIPWMFLHLVLTWKYPWWSCQ